jgi:phosphoglycolate phosphatase
MTDFPFAIVGFDLDGTLFDTSIELCGALNHALASDGFEPVDPATTRQLVGMGARHMLKMALNQQGVDDEEQVRALLPALIKHYDANLGSDCPAFPGLIEALDALAAQNVKLAIATNKFENLAQKLIANLGMSERFATVLGGDTMGKGRSKPAPDPIYEMIRRCGGGRAAFVGDSIHDMMAAKGANVPSIAVAFGFLHQPVEELGADAIIHHYDELIPTLHALA